MPRLFPDVQVASDGCSPSCQCEHDPCSFTVSLSVDLASVVGSLAPGATVALVAGTFAGGSCGWNVPSVYGADRRPITVRGAQGASLTTVVDCDNAGPVINNSLIGTHLRLERIHFRQSQRSGGSGGVLRAELGSRVVIMGCRFTACASDQMGGAIFVSNSTLVVSKSHFEENSAQESGGSLAVVAASNASVTDSIITRCTAADGGGVYVRMSRMAMRAMLLSYNSAIVNKGGAALVDDKSILNASLTTVAHNYATRGGGIMIQFSSVLGLAGGVRVVENLAVFYGGGIYNLVGSTIDCSNNVEIDSNRAGALAGGIMTWYSKSVILSGGVSISSNEVFGRANVNGNGGGIFGALGVVIELHEGVRISNNLAKYGAGGLSLQDSGTVLLARGATFEHNRALSSDADGVMLSGGGGGGLGLSGASALLHGCMFRNNSAPTGAGLYDDGLLPQQGLLVIEESTFISNVAYAGNGAGLICGRVTVPKP